MIIVRLSLFFTLLGICGCGDDPGYPPELTYPLRDDPLVLVPPAVESDRRAEPGTLDEAIAALPGLGGVTVAADSVPPGDRAEWDRFLGATFGRPAEPLLQGFDEQRLVEGSRLYKRLCLHCHGLTGDGRGPTGPWVQPHPRDLRQGVYKFVSSEGSAPRKPTRDDLRRLIRDGLPGSSMPPFKLLPDEDIERLADYVIHLSVRGEVEASLLRQYAEEGTADPAADGEFWTDVALGGWARADAEVIRPADQLAPVTGEDRFTEEHFGSVRRGYRLFADADGAGCIKCHADFGRQARYRYDVWGTQVRPRNLTEDVYRGGGRPIDLYHRIRGGIAPSGMPSHAALPEERLWDLVHFVEALPFPRRLPPDVRGKIYPAESE